jgi:hypothetical protein
VDVTCESAIDLVGQSPDALSSGTSPRPGSVLVRAVPMQDLALSRMIGAWARTFPTRQGG